MVVWVVLIMDGRTPQSLNGVCTARRSAPRQPPLLPPRWQPIDQPRSICEVKPERMRRYER
jgi:hypothetical protein